MRCTDALRAVLLLALAPPAATIGLAAGLAIGSATEQDRPTPRQLIRVGPQDREPHQVRRYEIRPGLTPVDQRLLVRLGYRLAEITEPGAGGDAGFPLLDVAWWSPEVKAEMRAAGWLEVPLIPHRFFCTRCAECPPAPWGVLPCLYDDNKYRTRVWHPWAQPQLLDGSVVCDWPEGNHWSRCGIPPGYDGFVDLDYEMYAYVVRPELMDPATTDLVLQGYVDLIETTRELRPDAVLIQHGLCKLIPTTPEGEAAVRRLTALVDVISPPIYPAFTPAFANLEAELERFDRMLTWCDTLRADLGVKVMPVVWKRYAPRNCPECPDGPGLFGKWAIVMPPAIMRRVLEVVAAHEPDGLMVFGPDGKNLYRRVPRWPPDTPGSLTVDAASRAWLQAISEVFADQLE